MSSKLQNEDKVYVNADQLLISKKGIFILLEGQDGNLSKILIPQLNWDENGIFVLGEYFLNLEAEWCRFGHKACDRCFRCNHPGCPSYGCRCRRR